MRLFTIILFVMLADPSFGQTHLELDTVQPGSAYDNVFAKKIAEDSLQSTFIIWIKKDVRGHFHQEHTENILVLEGRAEMLFNGRRIIVKKGDYLNIPKGTKHSVEKVFSRKPLKVVSIQSPHFDGRDRVFIENN